MEWKDDAVILGTQRHGEAHAILDCLTAAHGRWRALVRGGGGRRLAGVLAPGNAVRLGWRARLDQQLGSFEVELLRSRIAPIMADPARLLALLSITGTIRASLPERESHDAVHTGLSAFLDLLADRSMPVEDWGGALVRLELGLLADLGYGLDLAQCALTGARSGLAHVSPRTGRAVSLDAGRPWQDRLLPLPVFLTDERASAPDRAAIVAGLRLSGHFLAALEARGLARQMPPERDRLIDRLSRE